jgi:signal peptidase I
MKKFFKVLFGIVVLLVFLAVIGRIFLFNLARTDSYAMVPSLVPGDLFLVLTKGALGPGDIAVCRNPEDPSRLVVSRIIGVPGSTVGISGNRLVINDDIIDHQFSNPVLYVEDAHGEPLEFLANVAHEYIGGRHFEVAMMKGGGGNNMSVKEIKEGFFVIGDNRNRARDSRHFGEIPIRDCMGKAFLVIWPGEDSGDLKRNDRWFNWL